MSGVGFTERVSRIVALAREEAVSRKRESLGSEHILLGLLIEWEGVAAAVLRNLRIDLDDVQARVERQLMPGTSGLPAGTDIAFSIDAKRTLELAMRRARELRHA
jgi:ATP-dependent Clp protease ATP-binding subunit ClpC